MDARTCGVWSVCTKDLDSQDSGLCLFGGLQGGLRICSHDSPVLWLWWEVTAHRPKAVAVPKFKAIELARANADILTQNSLTSEPQQCHCRRPLPWVHLGSLPLPLSAGRCH